MTIQKKIIWGLIGIVLAGLCVWGFRWATYARPPLSEAINALRSDGLVAVTHNPWLTFTPEQYSPNTGFIFYPGGRIDPRGYSDMMRTISEKGYLVVVPTMPINMAIFDFNIADEIIAAHPEIAHWVIGGHSVGGTAAAQYTFENPKYINGLAIWSSYPADNSDLSDLNLPVILMYGGNETGVTDESVRARKHLDRFAVRLAEGCLLAQRADAVCLAERERAARGVLLEPRHRRRQSPSVGRRCERAVFPDENGLRREAPLLIED